MLAGAEGGNREFGMWTLDGARIIGSGVKHILLTHSFWLLPFPPSPSLIQVRQTVEPKKEVGKGPVAGPRSKASLGRPRAWHRPWTILGLLLLSPHS